MSKDRQFWEARVQQFGSTAVAAGGSAATNFWDNWVRRLAVRRLRFRPQGLLLEVGTGTGYWAELFARSAQVIAVDFCMPLLQLARARTKKVEPRIKLICCDITELPFQDCIFDAAVSIMCLQHVTNPARQESALKSIIRCLKPGATLLLIEGVNPRSRRDYIYPRSYNSWVELCTSLGAEFIRSCPVNVLRYKRYLPVGFVAVANAILGMIPGLCRRAHSAAFMFVRPE